jgi:ribosomal protein L11 methyltransferase
MQIKDWSEQFQFQYKTENIPYQNWNEVWESNFQPIIVDDFCGIRAEFHEPLKNVKHELIITPKMAFGTGHHETTFMMIQAMAQLELKGTNVFDYGCGTGVLALLAGKMGAKTLVGVDNEKPSYESTIENAEINGQAEKTTAYFGTLEAVSETDFDVILANINRNVILMTLHLLLPKLKTGGYILFSGFLQIDLEMMHKTMKDNGLSIIETKQKDKWCCLVCKKD